MKGWKITNSLRQQIYKYAQLPQTGVSLRQMVQFGPRPSQGSLFHASYFAVHELPIRLSHRVRELEGLPLGLADEESIKLVRDWYAMSFEELLAIPEPDVGNLQELVLGEKSKEENWTFEDDGVIVSRKRRVVGERSQYFKACPKDLLYPNQVVEYNKTVTEVLKKIKKRHDATVTTLAKGVQNWKMKNNRGYLDSSVNQFLDRFYMSRIGIRMLIGQTIALNLQSMKNMQDDDYVGIISLKCNVKEIAQDAIDAARFACEEHYNIMEIPKVLLYAADDLNFRYVPAHLVHMLYETLKNSLRATIEHHSKLNPSVPLEDIEYPPIKIIVAKGDEDITIKISDEGGGIPRSAVPLVWTYFYTSAEKSDFLNESGLKAPFMGLGVGLPHSRLYARYFHGDLKLISMEGYGTDVYLHLNRLGNSSEPLY
ncbi:hypothetical protein DAMA08_030460 [Martiniozyma asiatica (nom. inval.)]|nr:hypothetical protein DAMA08_030460 [Martiniozyma asiatica]